MCIGYSICNILLASYLQRYYAIQFQIEKKSIIHRSRNHMKSFLPGSRYVLILFTFHREKYYPFVANIPAI